MTTAIAMQDALEAVRSALVKRWPDCKVHLFGSTANQLSICNNNDIDVCLELPDLPSDAVRSQQNMSVVRLTCVAQVLSHDFGGRTLVPMQGHP